MNCLYTQIQRQRLVLLAHGFIERGKMAQSGDRDGMLRPQHFVFQIDDLLIIARRLGVLTLAVQS